VVAVFSKQPLVEPSLELGTCIWTINADDMDQDIRACVLDKNAGRHLFGNSNPIGKEIQV